MRRLLRAVGAYGWLGAGSCGVPQLVPLEVEAPAVLVLVLPESRPAIAFGAELAGTAVDMELAPDDAADSRLYALWLPGSLDELGLQSGWQSTDDDPGGLPPSDRILTAVARDGIMTSWTPLEGALPSDVAGLHVPTKVLDPCVPMEHDAFRLPGTAQDRTLFAVTESDASVLVGTPSRWFRVTEDEVLELERPETPWGGAFIDPLTSELWLAGFDGRVVRGRLDGTFEDTGHPAENLGAQVSIDGGDGELFLVSTSTSKKMDRYDGVSWSTVAKLEDTVDTSSRSAIVVRTGPGSALGIVRGGQQVTVYANGGARQLDLLDLTVSESVKESVHGLARVPGLGVFVVGTLGFVFLAEVGAEFRPPDRRFGKYTTAIVPFGSGALFGGQAGSVFQWQRDRVDCDNEILVMSEDIGVGAALGSAVVMFGETSSSEDLEGARIRTRRR
ncbi:MAG: hypothetical protein HYV07_21805 [Deltaproteobacteria bacterium]|nr:hypothetical protein [Deltaproteobacteria bacterium]